MRKNKHLSIEERSIIKSMLDQSASFKAIARSLGRDCSTISKEVRLHLVFKKSGCLSRPFNDCTNRFDCPVSNLCADSFCTFKKCSLCPKCSRFCPDYSKQYCVSLFQPPYVCSGCPDRNKCTLEKHLYSAPAAQQEYELVRSESRTGICLDEAEALALDAFISPLLKKGQLSIISASQILRKSCFPKKPFTITLMPVSFLPETSTCPERSPISPADPHMILSRLINHVG